MHTSAFRRLQAKTQVFLSGEYDFYRTRLTHSLEVAQIGRSICTWLLHQGDPLHDTFFIDPDLVEACCLAHDLGHPPFGYAGERSLNACVAHWGGFEGNAQTLHMLTETVYASGGVRRGMDPSRAFMDSILKYKTLHRELDMPLNHFLYDEQEPLLRFAHESDDILARLPAGKTRDADHSLECQVMDWADDTAYSINDVVDGIQAGFISLERVERWAEQRELSPDDEENLVALLRALRGQRVEAHMGKRVAHFIQATRLVPREHPLATTSNRYAFTLEIDPAIDQERRLWKQLSLDLVFRSPQICQLEMKGHRILSDTMDLLLDNYLGGHDRPTVLVPELTDRALHSGELSERQRVRLLTDYVAGMTDSFAMKTYRRLFDPNHHSIHDMV